VTKHIEKLGPYENFEFSSLLTAEEPDLEKLKKYVFGLLRDKAQAQDARDAAKADTTEVQTELDEANAKLSSNAPADLQAKLAKSEAKVKELEGKIADKELVEVRREVAKDKGLTDAQSKYLTGTTKDELEASADEFIKDNDIQVADPDGEDPEDDERNPLIRTPRATALNPGDPNPSAGPVKEPNYDQIVAGFESNPFR
jgi:hypothetical protein